MAEDSAEVSGVLVITGGAVSGRLINDGEAGFAAKSGTTGATALTAGSTGATAGEMTGVTDEMTGWRIGATATVSVGLGEVSTSAVVEPTTVEAMGSSRSTASETITCGTVEVVTAETSEADATFASEASNAGPSVAVEMALAAAEGTEFVTRWTTARVVVGIAAATVLVVASSPVLLVAVAAVLVTAASVSGAVVVEMAPKGREAPVAEAGDDGSAAARPEATVCVAATARVVVATVLGAVGGTCEATGADDDVGPITLPGEAALAAFPLGTLAAFVTVDVMVGTMLKSALDGEATLAASDAGVGPAAVTGGEVLAALTGGNSEGFVSVEIALEPLAAMADVVGLTDPTVDERGLAEATPLQKKRIAKAPTVPRTIRHNTRITVLPPTTRGVPLSRRFNRNCPVFDRLGRGRARDTDMSCEHPPV